VAVAIREDIALRERFLEAMLAEGATPQNYRQTLRKYSLPELLPWQPSPGQRWAQANPGPLLSIPSLGVTFTDPALLGLVFMAVCLTLGALVTCLCYR
jgi:hypothetical protein